ncbi:MAG: helix-turn-helix domain-containing protein [Haloglomus sp.]
MNGFQLTRTDRTRDESTTCLESASAVASVLSALDDPDCRGILDATGEEALTAREIAEACDLPTSTTYRKLDELTEASLLEERVRLRRSGKHASEYVRAVDDVVVTLGEGGLTVRLFEDERADSAAIAATFRAFAD